MTPEERKKKVQSRVSRSVLYLFGASAFWLAFGFLFALIGGDVRRTFVVAQLMFLWFGGGFATAGVICLLLPKVADADKELKVGGVLYYVTVCGGRLLQELGGGKYGVHAFSAFLIAALACVLAWQKDLF